MSDAEGSASEIRGWVRWELRNAKLGEDRWPALERAHIVSQPFAVLT